MAESNSTQILDSLVFCSMCREVYDDGDHLAKYLPCLHSFCKSCLQTCVGNETQFNCPKCQLVINLKDGCVDGLPDNFIVTSEENNFGEMARNMAESCGVCDNEKSQVVSFCHDCSSYLCQICVDSHKRMRPLRNHKLSPIQMKKPICKVKKQKFCDKHPNQEPTGFCNGLLCQLLVCNTCSTEDHAGHDVTELDDAVEKMTAKLQGLSKDLSSKKHKISLQNELVKGMHRLTATKFEAKVRDMEEQKQKLIKLIENQFNQAYTNLKNKFGQETGRLPDADKLGAVTEQIDTATEFANRACTTKDTVQLLTCGQQIESQLCELKRYQLPNVPVDFKNDATFTAKHDEAVKQIEKSIPEVFDVNWLADEQNQAKMDAETVQKIDTSHCIIDNFTTTKRCAYTYGVQHSPCQSQCVCQDSILKGMLQILNVNRQPLTSGPACNANVELVHQGKSLQAGAAYNGSFSMNCRIDKGHLPQVKINGCGPIAVTKLFLGRN